MAIKELALLDKCEACGAYSKTLYCLKGECVSTGWLLPRSRVNDIQAKSIDEAIDRCKRAHFTNLAVRIDGTDETHEADWVKHMVKT